MLNKNTKRIALRSSRTVEKFKTITVCELILEMPNSIFLLSGAPDCEQPTQPILPNQTDLLAELVSLQHDYPNEIIICI
jgi:hypothetical protein